MATSRKRYTLEAAEELRRQPLQSIERRQLPLLKEHLRQACRIPFYRDRFEACGLEIEALKGIEELARLPFTCRSDIDTAPERFGLPDREHCRDIALTSGTTGEPVVVPYTWNDLQRLAFNEMVAFHGAGVGTGDRVLLTVTLDRCFIAGLAYYTGTTRLGAAAIRSGPGQPERQWQLISRLRPRVMVGVPSFLAEVGRWAQRHGIAPAAAPIDTIVTIGEPARRADHQPTSLGRELQQLWGADLYSSYGATEFETAFCDCRMFAGGHLHPELILAEIVDDGGNVLPDGEPGEIVVTPLGVEGYPLVRFRTGDVARLYSEPCGCGWNSKRLGPVEGRLAQRLKYRGTTLYPETIFQALDDLLEVDGAYLEVRSAATGSDDITVVVGVGASGGQESLNLAERLQARLRVRPKVILKSAAEVKSEMTGEGGRKPKRFFDLR